MKAFFTHLFIQFKLGLRDKTLLIDFYIVPLGFYLIMGGVMSGINPAFKATLTTSMMAFAVTMGGLQGVAEPMARLRDGGTLRSYRVLGIPARSVFLTDLIGTFFHLLIACIIILATAPVFFKAALPAHFLTFFGVTAVFILSTTSVGLLFGVLAKPHLASMLSIIVFVFSVLLSGIMFPASMLPKALQGFSRVLPATYAMKALTGLSFSRVFDPKAGVALIVLAVIGIVCACVSVRRLAGQNRAA